MMNVAALNSRTEQMLDNSEYFSKLNIQQRFLCGNEHLETLKQNGYHSYPVNVAS